MEIDLSLRLHCDGGERISFLWLEVELELELELDEDRFCLRRLSFGALDFLLRPSVDLDGVSTEDVDVFLLAALDLRRFVMVFGLFPSRDSG